MAQGKNLEEEVYAWTGPTEHRERPERVAHGPSNRQQPRQCERYSCLRLARARYWRRTGVGVRAAFLPGQPFPLLFSDSLTKSAAATALSALSKGEGLTRDRERA